MRSWLGKGWKVERLTFSIVSERGRDERDDDELEARAGLGVEENDPHGSLISKRRLGDLRRA
jgi:hypothetical protein